MKALLKIEAIGDNTYQMMRAHKKAFSGISREIDTALDSPKSPYWCAVIYDKNGLGYSKNLLQGKRDYSKSNSVGSRGVFIWYTLLEGYVYEVSSPASWKRVRRYYVTVTKDGDIVEITEKDVDQWIKDHLV